MILVSDLQDNEYDGVDGGNPWTQLAWSWSRQTKGLKPAALLSFSRDDNETASSWMLLCVMQETVNQSENRPKWQWKKYTGRIQVHCMPC